MREIVISSRNSQKKRELKVLLRGFGIKVLDLNDFPSAPKVRETGRTFEENAKLKAVKIAGFTGKPALADDSGLMVDVLGGLPGVRSARFAGGGADYEANNRKLLRMLSGVPKAKRKARFVSVIAVSTPEGSVNIARGECKGMITCEPKGCRGFGYDPVFFYPAFCRTFAEVSASRKNSVSHRARALKKARPLILSCLRKSLS
jgi:XTP/dITP diphosphohydrolase